MAFRTTRTPCGGWGRPPGPQPPGGCCSLRYLLVTPDTLLCVATTRMAHWQARHESRRAIKRHTDLSIGRIGIDPLSRSSLFGVKVVEGDPNGPVARWIVRTNIRAPDYIPIVIQEDIIDGNQTNPWRSSKERPITTKMTKTSHLSCSGVGLAIIFMLHPCREQILSHQQRQ